MFDSPELNKQLQGITTARLRPGLCSHGRLGEVGGAGGFEDVLDRLGVLPGREAAFWVENRRGVAKIFMFTTAADHESSRQSCRWTAPKGP